MKVILSPSKTQDFQDYKLPSGVDYSTPEFSSEIKKLIQHLKKLTPSELSKLMGLSDKLTDLNFKRFQDFNASEFNSLNAKPALLAFQGDVYRDIDSINYSKQDWDFAQDSLRIISGLYGLLHPLSLIQPYRLEMKTSLKTSSSKDLYEFWSDTLANNLKSEMSAGEKIINLASNEYSKALLPYFEKDQVINIFFKEKKASGYRVIAIYAKFARGNMANQIVTKKITNPKELKKLDIDGYKYSEEYSSANEYVFLRG